VIGYIFLHIISQLIPQKVEEQYVFSQIPAKMDEVPYPDIFVLSGRSDCTYLVRLFDFIRHEFDYPDSVVFNSGCSGTWSLRAGGASRLHNFIIC
jgi:hypothetical protein